tara:strand:+ start:2581 stop:2901 length:321 start_codon:yes stop_codon:yes gene_type:complete
MSNKRIKHNTPPYFKKSTPRFISNIAKDNIATKIEIVLNSANIMVSDDTLVLTRFKCKPINIEKNTKKTIFNGKLLTFFINDNNMYIIASGMNKKNVMGLLSIIGY